jgi:hypothetical protein
VLQVRLLTAALLVTLLEGPAANVMLHAWSNLKLAYTGCSCILLLQVRLLAAALLVTLLEGPAAKPCCMHAHISSSTAIMLCDAGAAACRCAACDTSKAAVKPAACIGSRG